MSETVPELQVEVVSDVVCPWCFLGKRRFDKAAEAFADRARVTRKWQPYQLSPDLRPEGEPYRAYLDKRLGGAAKVDASWERLRMLGREEGVEFRFEALATMPNTHHAHRLVVHAQKKGDPALTDAVVDALFTAHFCDARDIGDRAVLADIGAAQGIDRAELDAMLAEDEWGDVVRGEGEMMRMLGVNSVPALLIARRVGAMGAQSPEALQAFFTQGLDVLAKVASGEWKDQYPEDDELQG